MEKEGDTIIISLGGSLIVPEEIDISFIEKFKKVIFAQVELGRRFVIVTGGGRVCRKYQSVAKDMVNASKEDLDWIGISALKLNAELMRVILKEHALEFVVANLTEKFPLTKPIIIGSAYKPGHSTDVDAVFAAKTVGASALINLSNIDYVYDSDPRTNPNAKKFEKISWHEYRALIPKNWEPGLSTPFDPVASQMAEEEGLKVVIMNGKSSENLESYLTGKDFAGTVIS